MFPLQLLQRPEGTVKISEENLSFPTSFAWQPVLKTRSKRIKLNGYVLWVKILTVMQEEGNLRL